MEGNAAIWLQAFRQRHDLGQWPQFITAVEAEFGANDQRQSTKALLNLKQQGTVDEYYREFQELVYLITMYNPHYDEHFFVTQLINGLKTELRSMVEAQVPDTFECALQLARVQQEILAADKHKSRASVYARMETIAHNHYFQKPALKLATGDVWKDRQLRDYRRANGLCFKCGDKYEPTHTCGVKLAATLNAIATEPCPV
jgi:hypothetical protein